MKKYRFYYLNIIIVLVYIWKLLLEFIIQSFTTFKFDLKSNIFSFYFSDIISYIFYNSKWLVLLYPEYYTLYTIILVS